MAKKTNEPISPDKGSTTNVRSWNANQEQKRMGFVKHDAYVMDHVAAPRLIMPLGRSTQRYMARADEIRENANLHFASWDNARDFRHPGILVYSVRHNIAGCFSPEISKEIFTTLWARIRTYNNAAKAISAGDLQLALADMMILRAHVENMRRILTVMASARRSIDNMYYSPEALMTALGFRLSAGYMRENWEPWFRRFNQNIVAPLNAQVWLPGFIPGEDRWSSLYSEIYKDTSADTHYTQMYLLRPFEFEHMTYELDELPDPDNPGQTIPTYRWHITQEPIAYDTTDEAASIAALNSYFTSIENAITELFYNEDVPDIVALLNTISTRSSALAASVGIGSLNIPEIAWEPEPLPLTYDFWMQSALHNATIMDGVATSFAAVDPNTSVLEQAIQIPKDTTAWIFCACSKILDLPVLDASQDDMINATQWCIGFDVTNVTTETTAISVPYGAFASDWIQRATLYTQTGADDPDLPDGGISLVPHNLSNWCGTVARASTTEDWLRGGATKNATDLLQYLSDFNMPPLQYRITDVGATVNDHVYRIDGTIGLTDVIYCAVPQELQEMHLQWMYAFWGYPIGAGNAHRTGTFAPSAGYKEEA